MQKSKDQRSGHLRDVINKLKPYLRYYLEATGTKIRKDGKFVCISPSKHDAVPSASFVPGTNDTVFRCHGCMVNGDIFTAAHWKEGLPIRGKEFIYNTVQTLARRFGIAFDMGELSEQDAQILHLREIYENAALVLKTFWPNRKHIEKRDWPEGLCYKMGIATVSSWNDFLSNLQGLRKYSRAELDTAGIKPMYFHPDAITFTIHDEFGAPIGFAARDMRHESNPDIPKYVNTSSGQLYDKRSIVYGLYQARYVQGPLTIVEGYADVVTAWMCGMYSTVAVCGSEPTTEQIELIEEVGKKDIILALDHDIKKGADGLPTGQSKTSKMIDRYVYGRRGVRMRIVDWMATFPESKMDLDSFLIGNIRKGLTPIAAKDAWEKIPKIDAFDWRLKALSADTPTDEVATCMIPVVAAEPIHARHDAMIEKLSSRTGIRRQSLERDLDDLLDLNSRRTKENIRRVTSKLIKDIPYATPDEVASILESACLDVKTIVDESSVAKNGIGTSLERAQTAMEAYKIDREGQAGLRTGFPVFDNYMSGLCPGFWLFGGFPNSGKSSLVANLSWNMVRLNPDAIVLVMTLDDSMEEWLAKYISIITKVPMSLVADQRNLKKNPAMLSRVKAAEQEIIDTISTGRLEIRDTSSGCNTSSALVAWMDDVKQRHPKSRVAAWLDNFHNLSDPGSDQRTIFSLASDRLHKAGDRGFFVGATIELIKNIGQDRRARPTLEMIKETGDLEYDAKGVVLIANELNVNTDTERYWVAQIGNNTIKKPILDCYIDKCKNLYGVWKGCMPVQFDPVCCNMVPRAVDAGTYGVLIDESTKSD